MPVALNIRTIFWSANQQEHKWFYKKYKSKFNKIIDEITGRFRTQKDIKSHLSSLKLEKNSLLKIPDKESTLLMANTNAQNSIKTIWKIKLTEF